MNYYSKMVTLCLGGLHDYHMGTPFISMYISDIKIIFEYDTTKIRKISRGFVSSVLLMTLI